MFQSIPSADYAASAIEAALNDRFFTDYPALGVANPHPPCWSRSFAFNFNNFNSSIFDAGGQKMVGAESRAMTDLLVNYTFKDRLSRIQHGLRFGSATTRDFTDGRISPG